MQMLLNSALRLVALLPAILIAAATANVSLAAEPVVRNVNLRGLQIGGTTTLIVDGDFLAGAKLLLPFAAQTELKADSTEKKATLSVTVPADVAPGYYNLRLLAAGGVSLPVLIGVDRLPQREAAAQTEALPVALTGVVNGAAVFETRFSGKAGQTFLAEVEAQRLESKLRPVLHLYDAQRKQLAWSWPTTLLQGDCRLEAKLPADGEYIVAVHDLEYAPPETGRFRLKMGEFASAPQVFPPVVAQGQAAKIELGLPGLDSLDFAGSQVIGPIPLSLPANHSWTGPRPFVEVSPHAELLEQAPPPDGGQLLPGAMVGVCGRLLTPYEEDRYRLPVAAGQKWRLEVFAERYGSPLDVAVIVRNAKGDPLARGEDTPGTADPLLDYTVPAATETLLVCVHDALGRGGPRGIYRLVATPLAATPPAAQKFVTPVQRISLAKGGRFLLPVFVEGPNPSEPVEILASDLPAGVKLEGTIIPPERGGALVSVVREGEGNAAVVSLVAKSSGGVTNRVTRQASNVAANLRPLPSRGQPWLDEEVALAPATENAADFQLDWRDLPGDAQLIPGRKLALPIKLTRPMGPGVVRLTLVSSQLPLVNANGQADAARALRAEQAVELAATALEGQLSLTIPVDLPHLGYQLAVQAELLSADKQTTLARAFTPVRDLPVQHQLAIELASARQETALDPKTGAKLTVAGKILRQAGLTGDVQLTAANLPAGVTAPAVTIKADATEFSLLITLPATLPPGELPPIQLSAAAPDNQNNNVRVTSRPTPLNIVILPPPASEAKP